MTEWSANHASTSPTLLDDDPLFKDSAADRDLSPRTIFPIDIFYSPSWAASLSVADTVGETLIELNDFLDLKSFRSSPCFLSPGFKVGKGLEVCELVSFLYLIHYHSSR